MRVKTEKEDNVETGIVGRKKGRHRKKKWGVKINKKILQKVGHNDPSTQQSGLVGIILISDSQVHQTNRKKNL